MKLHRFIGNFDFTNNDLIIKDGELINQIKNVLRLTVNEKIILVDGEQKEVLAKIINLNKEEIILNILERKDNMAEVNRQVTLFCSILKKENFELVVQKATECGVKKIIPIISNRTVKTGLKMERLEKIIKEAGEQSGRGILPEIEEPVSLVEAFSLAQANDLNLFFDLSGDLFKPEILGSKVGVFIGPEGGWEEKELNLAKEKGFMITSLGSLTLRGETAGIIASYLATH